MLNANLVKKQHPLLSAATKGHFGPKDAHGLNIIIKTDNTIYQIKPFANKAYNVGELLGTALPDTGLFSLDVDISLKWAGHNSWFIECNDDFATIKNKLKDVASIVNQSAAYTVLDISGSQVENFMLKGCGLDFNITVFPVGKCATSLMAHTNVHITRKTTDGFQMLIPASYAVSFWQWLELSAEEYGYDVAQI